MSELEDLVDPVKDLKLDEQPEDTKSMEDLPPELLTIILELLTKNETRNNILGYRLVNTQWKDIIDPIVEQRIVSGDFSVFPRMTISYSTRRQHLLHVRQAFSTFPADRQPFPFNSLVLDGWVGAAGETESFDSPGPRLQMIQGFMSGFGGNLTSFELQGVNFARRKSVLTLLCSLTSLKLLMFQNVTMEGWALTPKVVLGTLPSLPHLTTLVVKAGTNFSPFGVYYEPGQPGRVAARSDILYAWLIVSYADQLLHLDVEMTHLPALQRGLLYYYSFPNGKRLLIGTTSDSAFRNLKHLKISGVNNNFLRRGEVPPLQRLCFTNAVNEFHPLLLEMTEFISKCRNTLQILRLDIDRHALIGWEPENLLGFEEVLPPIIASPLPMIRRLEIHYSMVNHQAVRDTSIIYYTMTSRFLGVFLDLFPALETLHFLRFPADFISSARELETINGTVRAGELPIVAVKTRLVSLEQELYERNRTLRQQHAAIGDEDHDHEVRFELENDIEQEFNDMGNTFILRRAEILNELAALGVKKQEVVVEHFLESQGIWNASLKLKQVSVSSGEEPDGDVCLIRRPEEV